MSNTVPEGWLLKPLKSVVERVRRPVPREPRNVLTISSTLGWVDQRQKWARNMAGDSLQKYTYLKEGEFSYNRGNSKTFPYGCAFKLSGWGEAAVPNVYHSFKVLREKVDPDFVQHSFHAGVLDSQLRSIITSSARANGLLNITASDFFEVELAFPPLPEQQKIAAILSSVDDVIEKTRAQIDKLKDLKTGMMQELLTKGIGPDGAPHTAFKDSPLGRIPEGWSVATLESLLADVDYPMRSGPFGSSLLKSELVQDGIPYLGIDNVHVEKFEDKFRRFVSEEKFNELRRYEVKANDVMVTIMGTVGRCCVVPESIGRALSSKHVWTMTFDPELYAPELVCWQINYADWVQDQFKAESQGGVMDSISSKTLRGLLLPLPPIVEQRKIALAHSKISKTLAQKADKLSAVQSLKKALMQDLLTRKVRVKVS